MFRSTQKALNVRTLRIRREAQTRVPASWLVQKKATSTALVEKSLSQLSNLHISFPESSKSLHQRSPTSNRPVMFFTTQKSKAPKIVTMIKTKTLLKKSPEKKQLNRSSNYHKIAPTLNAKVATHEIGWAAAERSQFSALSSASASSLAFFTGTLGVSQVPSLSLTPQSSSPSIFCIVISNYIILPFQNKEDYILHSSVAQQLVREIRAESIMSELKSHEVPLYMKLSLCSFEFKDESYSAAMNVKYKVKASMSAQERQSKEYSSDANSIQFQEVMLFSCHKQQELSLEIKKIDEENLAESKIAFSIFPIKQFSCKKRHLVEVKVAKHSADSDSQKDYYSLGNLRIEILLLDPPIGTLQLAIQEAKIDERIIDGSFVTLQTEGDKFKTKVSSVKTNNPSWNETFKFEISCVKDKATVTLFNESGQARAYKQISLFEEGFLEYSRDMQNRKINLFVGVRKIGHLFLQSKFVYGKQKQFEYI